MWPVEYNLWDQKRSLCANSEKSCLFLSSCSCWMLNSCCFRWNVIPCHLLWEGFWASVSKASLELVCFGEAKFKVLCWNSIYNTSHLCIESQKGHPGAEAPSPPMAVSNLWQQKQYKKWGKWKPASSWKPWYFGTSWLGHWFQSFVFNNTYGFVHWEVEPHTHFDLHSTSCKGLQSLITDWVKSLFFLIAFNLLLVYFIRNLWYEK